MDTRLKLVNEREACSLLGLSRAYLALLRMRAEGPRYAKIGKAVRYDVADLAAWVENRKRGGEGDAK